MDGPQHYAAAEKLLSEASYTVGLANRRPATPQGMPLDPATHAAVIARAQVHATLALAAATALHTLDEFYEVDNDAEAWLTAASVGVRDEGQPDDPAHVDGALDRIAGHALTGDSLGQMGGAV